MLSKHMISIFRGKKNSIRQNAKEFCLRDWTDSWEEDWSMEANCEGANPTEVE